MIRRKVGGESGVFGCKVMHRHIEGSVLHGEGREKNECVNEKARGSMGDYLLLSG